VVDRVDEVDEHPPRDVDALVDPPLHAGEVLDELLVLDPVEELDVLREVVLDGIPVVRGMERATIVKELLKHATEMVDIDLVLMDREFDGQGVKDVCEAYNVFYLNPSRMYGDEKRTAKELRLDEIAVEGDAAAAAAGRPPRKRVWVPRANVQSDELLPDGGTPPDEIQDADAESASDPTATKAAIRKELVEDFLDIFSEDAEESADWALDEDLVDTAEEASYRETYAVDDDGVHHVVFETNHPDLDVTEGDTDEIAIIHKIARFTRQYANRWGIENGYRTVKSFMADTTSTDHRYRFLNFIFACMLYSLWRLVDMLLKCSLGDERSGTRVRGSTILTLPNQ
jgi:IS4 transposase